MLSLGFSRYLRHQGLGSGQEASWVHSMWCLEPTLCPGCINHHTACVCNTVFSACSFFPQGRFHPIILITTNSSPPPHQHYPSLIPHPLPLQLLMGLYAEFVLESGLLTAVLVLFEPQALQSGRGWWLQRMPSSVKSDKANFIYCYTLHFLPHPLKVRALTGQRSKSGNGC